MGAAAGLRGAFEAAVAAGACVVHSMVVMTLQKENMIAVDGLRKHVLFPGW